MRRPLGVSFLFFLAGIVFASYGTPALFLCALGVLTLGYLFCGFKKVIPWRYGLFLLVLVFAFGYTDFRSHRQAQYHWEAETYLSVEGVVCDFPKTDEKSTKFTLKTEKIQGEPVKVKVFVLAEPTKAIRYGNTVKLYAKVLAASAPQNYGGFDYEDYLTKTGRFATLSTWYDGSCLITGKESPSLLMAGADLCRKAVFRCLVPLPKDWQNILKGVFLGDSSGLSQEQVDLLTKSGIRHCFCVSGLHVGYIVLLVGWFLSFFGVPRHLRIFLLLPILAFYCGMTGLQPAVIRASIMCAMLYASLFCGRQGDGYTAMALAGYCILLENPQTLWLAGFQLSFVAMLGILYFTPFYRRLFSKDFLGRDALLVTLAAQTAVLPLVAYEFHVVSIVALFINTFCCLLAGGIVLLSFVGLVLSPIFGSVFFYVGGFLGKCLLLLLEKAVALPFAYFYCNELPLWGLILVAAILLLLPKIPWLRFRPMLSGLAVVLTLAALVFPFGTLQKQPLAVTFLSVGEGDCIYIATPHGEHILVDSGGSEEIDLYSIRPFLLSEGVNDLDVVFLTHTDKDHIGGFSSLSNFFDVKKLMLSKASYYYTSALEQQSAEADIDIVKTEAGQSFVYDDVVFTVLSPTENQKGDTNNLSLVLKVSYKHFSLLLTGDADTNTTATMMARGVDLKADVLKLPHHGSYGGYNEDFYQAVSPREVVVSVGKNSFGHPDKKVMAYWTKTGIPCYRTDKNGAVTFYSQGKGYWVKTYLQ